MIDCGKCGYEEMRPEEGGGFVCGHCGKTYTKEEAEQREQALNGLNQKRKLQLILMGCCMVFLIIAATLLPGYSNGKVSNALILTVTLVCLAFFLAALAVRIRFGKDRRKLYREE